jgi:hypothetical protein
MAGRLEDARQLMSDRVSASELQTPFWTWMRQAFAL